MSVCFKGQVAIVTGGGNGLGRAHCLALAERGASVVVNDFGGSLDGKAGSSKSANSVVEEIVAKGGRALANGADVTDPIQVDAMVAATLETFGRVDILINNAGILRDRTFSKMELSDFAKVVDVHLNGAVNCTKSVWQVMREQNYGRILMTSSSSGIYGNFGQSNYGAAKAALVGLMNVLHLEGEKYDIRVNTLAPTAATRMLDGLLQDDVAALMAPESVSPGALYLVSRDAPSRTILGAGAGCFAISRIYETQGLFLGRHATVDDVADNWSAIGNEAGQRMLTQGSEQTAKFVECAANALGVDVAIGGQDA